MPGLHPAVHDVQLRRVVADIVRGTLPAAQLPQAAVDVLDAYHRPGGGLAEVVYALALSGVSTVQARDLAARIELAITKETR